MNETSNKLLIVLAFMAIYFIWGTTFLVIVIGLESFPAFFMASMRFLIAGILLVGYSMVRKEAFPRRSSLIKNVFIAMVVLVGGQGLLIWSEQYIASGYASVLVATLPIWYVTMDKAHWHIYFKNPFILIGVLLGFGGIVILFRDKLSEALPPESIQMQLIASVVVMLGGMCWVIGTLYNKSRPAPGSMYQNLGWQLIFGSLICMLISYLTGEFAHLSLSSIPLTGWAAVSYLSVAGSVIAFIAYTWLLRQMPSALVGTYAYINPMVAVFLGWLLADEIITRQQMIGMMIILASAVMINLNRNKIKA